MKVLVIGSGGREHALVWACRKSPLVTQIYCAPGNIGMRDQAICLPVSADDIDALLQRAKDHAIDLVIVGPEQPLVLGIVDRFQAAGIPIWGPLQAASRLEGSKRFAKDFMKAHGIPTAPYGSFTDFDTALSFLKTLTPPYVIKADGLAGGKGVVIAPTFDEATQALREMLCDARFGSAGREVVIEAFLEGEEASFIAICDGEHALPFASSQDHKRLLDLDQGPNTGGMGAYSPAPVLTQDIEARVMRDVIEPVLRGMKAAGTPYRGFLYAGLMIDRSGQFNVLEFNCRMGDPETQPLLFRLESDLVATLLAGLDGKLHETTLTFSDDVSVCVVLAAKGYPMAPEKGQVITGLGPDTPDTKVFHAGTRLLSDAIVVDGGRVLGVTARGATLEQALSRVYTEVSRIHFDGMQYRRDIGRRGLS